MIDEKRKEYFISLDGKEFKYQDDAGYIHNAIVTNCDFDIGITIVKKDNIDFRLFCGKNPTIFKTKLPILIYEKIFNIIIDAIEKGFFDHNTRKLIDNIILENGSNYIAISDGSVPISSCAFAQ